MPMRNSILRSVGNSAFSDFERLVGFRLRIARHPPRWRTRPACYRRASRRPGRDAGWISVVITSPIGREGADGGLLILAHEAAVAFDIGTENGSEFALHTYPLPRAIILPEWSGCQCYESVGIWLKVDSPLRSIARSPRSLYGQRILP